MRLNKTAAAQIREESNSMKKRLFWVAILVGMLVPLAACSILRS